MADPHWTSYVGMVTGIFGAIMGFVSYRKSNSLKSLELRLKLRKEEHTATSSLASLTQFIDQVNISRQRVAAATGSFKSSTMDRWKKEVEEDKATLANMLQNAPRTDDDYEVMNEKELESRLVKVHELQSIIDKIQDKYEAALRADDKSRDVLREARNNRH